MKNTTIILLGLAMFAYASTRSTDKTKPTRFQQFQGWQKIFGVVAVILTLLIVLNPEFLALGLLGDTAFFDMLVLALSLQLHTYATHAWRRFATVVTRGVRWAGIPSPGLCYLLAVSTLAIASAVSAFQKAVHRIVS